MAPAHLQGALSNIHMAPGHLQGALSQPQARRRALRVSLGSTRPTTRAARRVRHTKTDDVHLTSRSAQRRRSFPSPSTSKFSSLPSITISVTPCRTTRKPDDGARRDFACTSTWPHDGALPKHGAPRAASGRVVNLPATRPNFGSLRLPKLTNEKLRNLPKLPEITKTYQVFCLAQMRVFRYRFRKPSSVCVAL